MNKNRRKQAFRYYHHSQPQRWIPPATITDLVVSTLRESGLVPRKERISTRKATQDEIYDLADVLGEKGASIRI
jgi:hypothetical protein